jgi:hypothetical protein
VKLFSFHLLLMAVFLAAPDLPRLAQLLVLNRATAATPAVPLSERGWINRGAPMLVSVLGAFMAFGTFFWAWKEFGKRQAELSVRPPYYGVWVFNEFTAAGGSLFTAKLTEEIGLRPGEERWKSLSFERPMSIIIQCANDALESVNLALDTNTNRAVLTDDDDPKWKAQLTLENWGPQSLAIHGNVNGSEIKGKLHRMDESQFRLISTGFHFINEGALQK